jgi:hypothetical protein
MSLFLVLAAAAFGESRYDVPFAFRAGNQSFTAGQYRVAIEPMMRLVRIWPEGGAPVSVRLQNDIQANSAMSSGKLVFHCYGRSCVLSQIWRAGTELGTQLPEPKAQPALASEPRAEQVISAKR